MKTVKEEYINENINLAGHRTGNSNVYRILRNPGGDAVGGSVVAD